MGVLDCEARACRLFESYKYVNSRLEPKNKEKANL